MRANQSANQLLANHRLGLSFRGNLIGNLRLGNLGFRLFAYLRRKVALPSVFLDSLNVMALMITLSANSDTGASRRNQGRGLRLTGLIEWQLSAQKRLMTFSSDLAAYQSSSRHSLKTDLVGCSATAVTGMLRYQRRQYAGQRS